MKFGFKHVAIAAVLAFGAMSTTPATVQAQLAPALQQQVNAALAAGGPVAVLAALNAVMTANPAAAGAIAGAAGAGNPLLVVAIGGQLATVVAASALTPDQQAAQISTGSQGLAAANPGAAGDIVQTIGAVAPQFAGDAATGALQGAPGQADQIAIVVAGIAPPAAPPAPPVILPPVVPVVPPEPPPGPIEPPPVPVPSPS